MRSKKLDISLILMGAGSSNRFSSKTKNHEKIKKQWLRVYNLPLWQKVANDFKKLYDFKDIIITSSKTDIAYMKKLSDYRFVLGGLSRQKSLENALEYIDSEFVLVSDIARWNIDKEILDSLLNIEDFDCVVPYLDVVDSVMYQNKPIGREELKLIQTPQLSRLSCLKRALKNNEFSDESSAISSIGGKIKYIKGSLKLNKITHKQDLFLLKNLLPDVSKDSFIGSGFDVHSFEKGKKMLLGGIEIESSFGFKAHSDGDVLLHSLCDAMLGAINAGDIGEWFPDADIKYKNIDSKIMLKQIYDFVLSVGFELANADITVIAEIPKISPYKDKIQKNIAELLSIQKSQVSIKATTTESLGFIGRKEGVAVMSNVVMKFIDWKKIL